MHAITNLYSLQSIRHHLEGLKTIAVVGLSPKEHRPSNMVARYLLDAGFTVVPVNPGQNRILDLPCYPDLASIPQQIDIVDIFRRSEDVLPIVRQAIALTPRPGLIWMQQNIVNQEAAELARKAGIDVVMDRCIKIEHASLGD